MILSVIQWLHFYTFEDELKGVIFLKPKIVSMFLQDVQYAFIFYVELKQRKDQRKQWMFVVTGRGNHSQGGRARIKPAIFDYLNRNKYT